MNNTKFILGAIIMITLGTTAIMTTLGFFESANALKACGSGNTTHSPSSDNKKAPPAITGDNVYVAWWTNKTGNDEVMFRASTDIGKTFGDVINLSNSTNADSNNPQLASTANELFVVWQEDLSGNNQIYFTKVDTL